MSNRTDHKKSVHISLRMLSFSSPLVGPMFDYSSFNSKRWDWANVENLSEPNLWIIKTSPAFSYKVPFSFAASIQRLIDTYCCCPGLGDEAGYGKIDREEYPSNII